MNTLLPRHFVPLSPRVTSGAAYNKTDASAIPGCRCEHSHSGVRESLLLKAKSIGLLAVLLLLPILSHAQLSFPSSLQNELDQTQISESAREVVVLIHGWTAENTVPANFNFYEESDELYYLVNILKLKLGGSDNKLVTYHWEKDATTGSVWDGPLGIPLWTDFFGYGNATEAAINAQAHGGHLATLLHQAAPNLRTVHFIAHSAGSWAAREAAKALLATNPYVVVQVTLLDPFIPDANFGMTTGLSTPVMSGTDSLNGADRIYRLENYFADDAPCLDGAVCWNILSGVPTLSTQEQFAWRNLRDINLQIDWGLVPAVQYNRYYDFHSGPIEFYADTVAASIQGQQVPVGLVGGVGAGSVPFEFIQVGWYRSILSEDFLLPRITGQPQGQSVAVGGTTSFSVTANRADSFRWFKNGQPYSATDSILTFSAVSSSDAGEYVVRVSNSAGQVFSEKAVLQVTSTPTPTISDVSPRTLNALPLPQTQLITITGTGFTSSSRLTFNDGVNPPFTDRVPASWTATQLTYSIAVGPVAATWTVKVVNGGVESLPYTFYVISGSAQLTALSISGPAAINENASGQFAATAYFSDGSSQTATASASWSENSGFTTISSVGLLSAASVSSDTAVTVLASYTAGGLTRSASANVTVVNTGGGGTQTQELIVNGDLTHPVTQWDLAFNFYADNRFATARSPGGYAYLSNPDGSAGNNLYGEIAQYVTIPNDATLVTLSYWCRITTAETGGSAFDTMTLQVVSQAGSVETVDNRSNLHANGSYQQRSFDITRFKGQRILIGFAAATDGSLPTTFRIDDVSVLATVPNTPTAVLLGMSGPSSVPEGTTAQYNAIVVYSDGSVQSVNPTWGENSGVTTISSSGVLSAGSVSSDTIVTVSATYPLNGVSTTVSKNVTIVNVAATFSYLAISGPSSVNENSSGQFTAIAIFSDGSSQSVSPSWSENSTTTSISGSGQLTAGEVSSDTTVTVSTSHTIGGITRNANQDVLIVNVPIPPTLASLSISGLSSVTENSTAQYTANASFSDGSSQVVNPTWGEDSSATSISIFGLLSAGEVANDTPMTVSASYSFGGVTRNASKSVTVVNGTVTPSYTLTVSASNGIVVKNPDQATYTSGSQVVLTATPTNGYQFSSWSGDVSGSVNPLTVTMTASKSVMANFVVVSPVPHLSEMSVSDGMSRFVLRGPIGSNFLVEASSDLVGWTVLGNYTIPAGGSLIITDPINGDARRFFRAVPQGQGPFVLQPGPIASKDIWTTSVYSFAPGGSFPGGGLNDDKLRVGGWGDEYYSLLQFDLTGLPPIAASAVLYLYCHNQSGGGTTMYLDRVTQAWDWRTQGTGRDRERLWWADRPSTTQWIAGTTPNPGQGQWYAVDLTNLYNSWQKGTHANYGVQFRPVNFFNNNFNEFYSADYVVDPTLRPKLIVTP